MVIRNKSASRTIVTFRSKYSIKNSFSLDASGNNQTQVCTIEGEIVPKFEAVTSEMAFKYIISIDEINEKFCNLQYDEFTDMLDKEISDEILSLLYVMSVYTINNCKATAGSKNCSFQELYQYLDQIIPLGNKNKIQCFETAESLNSPEFVIDVKIVEALRLKWKKYLEFSRLFCKMWISSNPEQVEFTDPVDFPIHPIWNASYRLNVKNPEGDALIIEIRKMIIKRRNINSQKQQCPSVAVESTDETKVPQAQPEDHLFGWSEIRLSEVFCEGIDIWVPVKSLKNGRTKGYLHIVMKIGISKQNGGIGALRRHLLLIRLCIEDYFKVVDREKIISSWEQMVSSKASTLIYLHSVIEGIPTCEDIISWFIVVNHIAVNDRIISFQFIHNLLLSCEKNIRQLFFVKGRLDCFLETAFEAEVDILNKRCFRMIENLHSLDLAENKYHRNDLEYSLRIIQISNGILKLHNDPVFVMKSEAQKWLEKMAINIPIPISDKIKYLIEFTEYTKNFLNAADRIIGKVYPEVLYTRTIYDVLDNLFEKYLKDNIPEIALKLMLIDEKDQLLMDTLKLFESCKSLLFYINKVTKDQIFEEKFESLCIWFGTKIIENWFNCKTRVAICQIKMALCFDDLTGANTYKFGFAKEKISSTTKIIPDILRTNLVELWQIVSNITFSNYNRIFIKNLHECCILFVTGLLNKNPAVILSADKRKTTRKMLYLVANDLNFLSSFISQIISNTVNILPTDMVDPKAFLLDASQRVCAAICESLLFVANKRIKRILDAKNKLQQKLIVINYAAIMERKIWREANQHLTSDAFMIFLMNFSQRILDIIQNYVKFYNIKHNDEMSNNLKSKKKTLKLIFEGLLEISKETEKLCLGFGEMDMSHQIWNDEFKELERKIKSILNDNETL
ncbi:hypothetical protein HNY73_022761 [Argiope bruennichi]|uniref:Uncharacterized protein n=1 Tax=Argiope bruennichi TaxID=94029 RepID=A0A8T0E493_ARGBR|nr:hypothetical protein HNY73_022761 [Argiope bruennichi]